MASPLRGRPLRFGGGPDGGGREGGGGGGGPAGLPPDVRLVTVVAAGDGGTAALAAYDTPGSYAPEDARFGRPAPPSSGGAGYGPLGGSGWRRGKRV
jgi:hypothetical protein